MTPTAPQNGRNGAKEIRRSIGTLPLLLLVAAVGLLPSLSVSASSVSAQMTVSVKVIARAVMSIDNEPTDVLVTEADVARGYVDLTVPMTINVRTNSRSGYLLQVSPVGGAFAAVDLNFDNSSIHVSTEEGMIVRPYRAGGDTLSVNARLTLAPGTAPGRHATPFGISASPL